MIDIDKLFPMYIPMFRPGLLTLLRQDSARPVLGGPRALPGRPIRLRVQEAPGNEGSGPRQETY